MQEIIYKGATRPPIFLGVPLMPGLVAAGSGAILGTWSTYLFSSAWWFAGFALTTLALLAWMRILTKKDDHRCGQWLMWAQLQLLHSNRALWGGCRSYAPVVYPGGRDVV
jgi:type IV secretion system protein VirB3